MSESADTATTEGASGPVDLVDPRRWQRRLRRSPARGRARHERRDDRERQGRRHLPAPRLHPHQGPAALGRDGRRHQGGRPVRRQRHVRVGRHGRRQRLQGQGRRGALQGPHRPGEEPQDRDDPRHRPPGLPDRRRGRRPDASRPSTCCWRPARSPAPCPAWSSTASASSPATTRSSWTASRPPPSSSAPARSAASSRSVWRSFGAEVTIVEALPHLVPLEEECSSKLLERAFRKRGIKQRARRAVREGRAAPTRAYACTSRAARPSTPSCCSSPSDAARCRRTSATSRSASRWTAASSRSTPTARPRCPTISAVGDLIPTLQLAHVGFAEGILVAERLAGLPVTPVDYDGVPRVTYSHPEVASVGLTTALAKERGYEVVEATYDLAGNGKARILGTAGAVKVVAAKDGPVLGVHMVGDRVGELIAEAQLITNWEALPAEVAQLIHPHPTMSEAVGEAHLALAGKPLHSHS